MSSSSFDRRWRLTATLVSLLWVASTAHAAPGDLDPSFGSGGVATVTNPDYGGGLFGLALAPDGKIVATGGSVAGGSSSAPYLVRFDASGNLDASFGSAGIVLVDLWGQFNSGLLVQSDGKIITADFGTILRYDTAGVLDATFATDIPLCIGYGVCVYTMLSQPDGKILAGTAAGLVRYDGGGSIDTGFGNGGIGPLSLVHRDIALQSDGKIVGAIGSIPSILLVRYHSDGTLDTGFGDGGLLEIQRDHTGGVAAVGVQPDGKILALSFDYNRPVAPHNLSVLMRLDSAGALDPSFGSGGIVELALANEGAFGKLALQADGKIVLSGGDNGIIVARLNANGSWDAQFGNSGIARAGGFGSPNALTLQSDGKIVIAGSWRNGTDGGPSVARFMADNSPLLNTFAGSNVHVSLGSGTAVTFNAVSSAGSTSVTTSSTGPMPPTGFQTGTPAIYYDIQTTASYTAPVITCITYDPTGYADPSLARLFHYEGGTWVDVTTSNDTLNSVICGQSNSLSPFAIMTPRALQAQVQQPINADGSSVFAANRGVVPVKFSLISGGQPTCSLPAAKIAVYRTGGASDQPITESVYSMAADDGSLFRVAGCQYVYNLNAKALGKGSYSLQVVIGNAVAGGATFVLK